MCDKVIQDLKYQVLTATMSIHLVDPLFLQLRPKLKTSLLNNLNQKPAAASRFMEDLSGAFQDKFSDGRRNNVQPLFDDRLLNERLQEWKTGKKVRNVVFGEVAFQQRLFLLSLAEVQIRKSSRHALRQQSSLEAKRPGSAILAGAPNKQKLEIFDMLDTVTGAKKLLLGAVAASPFDVVGRNTVPHLLLLVEPPRTPAEKETETCFLPPKSIPPTLFQGTVKLQSGSFCNPLYGFGMYADEMCGYGERPSALVSLRETGFKLLKSPVEITESEYVKAKPDPAESSNKHTTIQDFGEELRKTVESIVANNGDGNFEEWRRNFLDLESHLKKCKDGVAKLLKDDLEKQSASGAPGLGHFHRIFMWHQCLVGPGEGIEDFGRI